MVELQSCAGLVNASALCSIQQEAKGESVSVVIAELSAELQKEREKNARLMERISLLEAQIQERDKAYYSLLTHNDGQGSSSATERYMSKCKRQKTEATICERIEDGNIANNEMAARKDFGTCIQPNDGDVKEPLVNWMILDETHFLQFDNKVKDVESAADCEVTDESDDEDDDCCQENESNMDLKNKEINGSVKNVNDDGETEGDKRDIVKISEHRSPEEIHNPGNRKSAKLPFCPKEVKRILECEHLLLKNAQSHTIRKILVFASLGIRHGCEDMYELDFNHFHILRKGEPYVSSENPGEHVLYENPEIRKKVFYPNRKNPTLCPIQILEEEKAMRPSDPSCPSYLFLCIKYGGRTRNLPQNEYVRQRMGRNKLKSFGPIMCKMALLVNVRSGSFFFKALGITLLFMAGFPDDLVQRETKYRNLDLLQKYYRTDEDAEKEKLFLPYSAVQEIVTSATGQSTGIKASTKSKARKQSNSTSKPPNSQNSSIQQQSAPSNSLPPTPFGLMGYTPGVSTQVMNNYGSNFSYHNQFRTPYQIFPPQPPNTFMPMLYWPPPPPPQNAFPRSPYPATYAYQPFPSTGNYISFHPHLYNNQPSSSSFVPKMVEGNGKNNAPREETVGDSSSSTETKKAPNKGMQQLMNHSSGHA